MSTSIVALAWISLLPTLQAKNTNEAVKKGVDYLRSQQASCLLGNDVVGRKMTTRELALWTLINAGVSPKDPFYAALFDDMVKDKLEATYPVALQAMILEFLDRARFQGRIAMCAQFLVDNQSSGGYWSYGSPSIYVEDIVSDKPGAAKALTLPDVPQNPKVAKKWPIRKNRDGEGNDSSNSAYAALGMRACHDAGITFEPKTIDLAIQGWKTFSCGTKEQPEWRYEYNGRVQGYSAANAGAITSLLIYGSMQGQNLKKDPLVLAAYSSLAKTWEGGELRAFDGNAGGVFHLYGLYSVEVAALFLGQNKLGDVDWYEKGSSMLLARQNPDGSWGARAPNIFGGVGRAVYSSSPLVDTCYALLFLTKGIKPLPDPASKKK